MRKSDRHIWALWMLLFFAAMILPCIALVKLAQTMNPLLLLGTLSVVWMITFLSYWLDKRKAEKKEWRIPESNLQFLALMGGWGSAFWAQRIFRHKIRKVSFQVTFWLIAFCQQFLAYDFLQGWGSGERLVDLMMSLVK